MSLRVSISRPDHSACSGLMYSSVPITVPNWVNIVRSVSRWLTALAPPTDRLLLLGHVHDAHAPLADRLQQLVGTDPCPRPLGDATGSGDVLGRPGVGRGRGSGGIARSVDGGFEVKGVEIHRRVS